MKNLDVAAFDSRVATCSQKTRELVAFLQLVAQHAGENTEAPTFDSRGVGITYWTNGRRFCRFDPKHQADHVSALVPGAARDALRAAGDVSDRDDGPWVVINDFRGAVRLVPHILAQVDELIATG